MGAWQVGAAWAGGASAAYTRCNCERQPVTWFAHSLYEAHVHTAIALRQSPCCAPEKTDTGQIDEGLQHIAGAGFSKNHPPGEREHRPEAEDF